MRNDHPSGRGMRPIRPFMIGMTTGAFWAALHVPPVIDAASAVELTATALAVAIVSGGVLALMAELASVGIRFGRSRTHYGR